MYKKEYSRFIPSFFSSLDLLAVAIKSFGGKFFEGQYLKEPEDADKDALAPVNPHYDC
jgi:hypothetical protein